MLRRVFGRVMKSRLLVAVMGATLLALGVSACGAARPVLSTQTVVRATQIAPTVTPTPYATAPGGNVTPQPVGSVAAAGTAAGSAVAGSPNAGMSSGSAAGAMATPTPTVRR